MFNPHFEILLEANKKEKEIIEKYESQLKTIQVRTNDLDNNDIDIFFAQVMELKTEYDVLLKNKNSELEKLKIDVKEQIIKISGEKNVYIHPNNSKRLKEARKSSQINYSRNEKKSNKPKDKPKDKPRDKPKDISGYPYVFSNHPKDVEINTTSTNVKCYVKFKFIYGKYRVDNIKFINDVTGSCLSRSYYVYPYIDKIPSMIDEYTARDNTYISMKQYNDEKDIAHKVYLAKQIKLWKKWLKNNTPSHD